MENINLTEVSIQQLLVFSILMQNHSGDILDKSPSYIREKFYGTMIEKRSCETPETWLDDVNSKIFRDYITKWIQNV